MQAIAPPTDRELLQQELTPERYIRPTNKGGNEIYIINHHNAPNVMREIGRLRELTFRSAGGGTGKALDIDDFDTSERPYQQLIVWEPRDKEIVGGYRFIHCAQAITPQEVELSTTELLEFSDTFVQDYLPVTIELGRSFVQPRYRPGPDNRAGLFSLDNLWDGLGALIALNPQIRYFFGKVTMYPHFQREARDLILAFLQHFFPPRYDLARPTYPLMPTYDTSAFIEQINGMSYKEAHRMLNIRVRELGENIPPLVNSYMNLTGTLITFGTAVNPHFGDVEETGMMVTINDIYPSKKERHVDTYFDWKGSADALP